jgi:hypothetical protein
MYPSGSIMQTDSRQSESGRHRFHSASVDTADRFQREIAADRLIWDAVSADWNSYQSNVRNRLRKGVVRFIGL